ncbi:hypothetical protein M404DRAFT_335068 [Pisolithus tinctorius Marx 270]|uniref:Uncharacterized protein n=1 Tax=Pisolithus tinctorius Marx 270 TaxID=870435 RepID=A0A0C3ID70_PISTI|nr:hypothetical protein M404DRAFT_335068 [Pisolithus tinctorius Marx 270]
MRKSTVVPQPISTSSAIFSRVFVKRRISLSRTVRSIKGSAFRRSLVTSTRNAIPPESSQQVPGTSAARLLPSTNNSCQHGLGHPQNGAPCRWRLVLFYSS